MTNAQELHLGTSWLSSGLPLALWRLRRERLRNQKAAQLSTAFLEVTDIAHRGGVEPAENG